MHNYVVFLINNGKSSAVMQFVDKLDNVSFFSEMVKRDLIKSLVVIDKL